MASPSSSRNLVNDFLKLLKKIALELRKEDIEILTFLIGDRIKIPESPKVSGLHLISRLKENRLLSENNLDYFIELLDESHRKDLGDVVREYQKKSVTTLKNAPQVQIEERLPAYSMEFLCLVFPGQKDQITVRQIDHIKQAICEALQLKLSEVFYVKIDGDDESPLYSRVMFQLPEKEEKINQLQIDAVNKKTWLTNLRIIELTVNNKSSIKLAEKKKDAAKQSKNGEKKPVPALPRVQSVLGLNPELQVHCNETFDIILAIEIPRAAPKKMCKLVLDGCESALKVFNQGQKVRLGVIRFGNHSPVPVRLADQQQVAFLEKDLSESLIFTSQVKPEGYCGGNAESGIADALHVVHGCHGVMRREATRLCIVTCFITEESADLQHYRSPFGHDAIKLSHDLAMQAIPLYIIGIDLRVGQATDQLEENYLLSGITAVTGGRYFHIQDVNILKELINCIIKENNSIEKNMGTVNDVVITEINDRYGDVNDEHLTDLLHNKLCIFHSEIDCITRKGKLLSPISQISERISWADDLNEAIDYVKKLKKNMDEGGKNQVTIPNQELLLWKNKPSSELMKPKPSKRYRVREEPKEFVTVRQNPNLEVAGRMVRRQIERSAYYRPTTEKDMYP